jgi:hypothetical protein
MCQRMQVMTRFAMIASLALGISICACGNVAQNGLYTAATSNPGAKGLAGGGSPHPAGTPFGPQYAKPAHCGDLKASDAPRFFKISGVRVALPADNPLTRDETLVQPGSVPIAHYGIGVDDGTGICAVYMPNPPVAIGGHMSLVVQAVRSSGGGVWLGWVDVAA